MDPSNLDTLGTFSSVLFSEVSCFQGLNNAQMYYLGLQQQSLYRGVSFQRLLIRGVPPSTIFTGYGQRMCASRGTDKETEILFVSMFLPPAYKAGESCCKCGVEQCQHSIKST